MFRRYAACTAKMLCEPKNDGDLKNRGRGWTKLALRGRRNGSSNRGSDERRSPLSKKKPSIKENGAAMVLTDAGDWNVDFFKKNGYLVRGQLKDVPKGHNCYELFKKC